MRQGFPVKMDLFWRYGGHADTVVLDTNVPDACVCATEIVFFFCCFVFFFLEIIRLKGSPSV